MSTTDLTGGDLRRAVYKIVARELGTSALARFIQENYPGHGDYTAERQGEQQPDVDQILDQIKRDSSN